VDVWAVAERVERRLRHLRQAVHVAVMGCEVNGPGEAKAADLGIAGAAGGWVLFVAGRKLRSLSAEEAEQVLVEAALELARERER